MEFYKAKKAILLMIVMFLLFTFTSCSPVDNTADNAYESEEGVETEIANSPTQSSIINQNQSTEPETTEYTVTFINWDNDNLKTENVVSGNNATAPSPPARKGYTFTGWDKSFEKVESDIVITAVFSINSCTVTFNTDGGSSVASINQNFDTQITSPENPIKEGYIFSGWFPALPAKMPAEDIALTAQWEIIPVKVTSIQLDRSEFNIPITESSYYSITATLQPSDATNRSITWTSSNPSVVSVDNNGKILGKSAGTATITATSQDGNHMASCVITVNEFVFNPASGTIKGYTGTSTDLVIPSSFADVSVKHIWERAFFDNEKIMSVFIPKSVISIESEAFYYNQNIVSVVFEKGSQLSTIGERAFSTCNFGKLELPDSITSIDKEAFRGCSNLCLIKIGSGVRIGEESFHYDNAFRDAYVSEGAGDYVYDNQTNSWKKFTQTIPVSGILLDKSEIRIPQAQSSSNHLEVTIQPSNATIKGIVWTSSNPSVARVGYYNEIYGASTGTAVVTATTVDGDYIARCTVTVYDMSSSGDFNFDSGTGTILAYTGTQTELVIPSEINGVTVEHISGFGSNDVLSTLILPQTIKSIKPFALYWCSNLYVLEIGPNVQIADDAFQYTSFQEAYTTSGAGIYSRPNYSYEWEKIDKLVNVTAISLDKTDIRLPNLHGTNSYYFEAILQPSDASNKGIIWSCSNSSIVEVASNGDVGFLLGQSAGTAVITVKTVDGNFTASGNVTVYVPIEENGFIFDSEKGTIIDYIGSEVELVVPSTIGGISVEHIGYRVFYYASSIESIVFPDSIKTIGNENFDGCSNLKTVKVGSGVQFEELVTLKSAYDRGGSGTYSKESESAWLKIN